jgi:hypothetical protein
VSTVYRQGIGFRILPDRFDSAQGASEYGLVGRTRLKRLHTPCRKEDGVTHVISLADVAFAESTREARYLAAYRKWAGLDPFPVSSTLRKHRASEQDLDISQPEKRWKAACVTGNG